MEADHRGLVILTDELRNKLHAADKATKYNTSPIITHANVQ